MTRPAVRAGAVTRQRNGWLRDAPSANSKLVAADGFQHRSVRRGDEETAIRKTPADIAVGNGTDEDAVAIRSRRRTGMAGLPSSPLMATWWEMRNLRGRPFAARRPSSGVRVGQRARWKPLRSGRRGVCKSSGRNPASFQRPMACRAGASRRRVSTNTRWPWLRNSPR